MKERRIIRESFDRYLMGRYSDEDASYVRGMFCNDAEEEELKRLMQDQFDEISFEEGADNSKLERVLNKIHYGINTKCKDEKSSVFDDIIKWTLRIAGVIIVPLVVYFGMQTYNNTKSMRDTVVEIFATANSRTMFSLPDGTNGWLNGNSSIKYNGDFNDNRQVSLVGEAFFDVAESDKSPFVVSAGKISVTVLGTRFNIAAYEDEEILEVVLEEGKLLFGNVVKAETLVMHPNEKLSYNKTSMNVKTEVVQVENYLSWKDGKLVFRNEPLDVIGRKLERWYNIDVVINDIMVEDGNKLRATFMDESLEDVLNLIKLSFPIDYTILPGALLPDNSFQKTKVVITPRPK